MLRRTEPVEEVTKGRTGAQILAYGLRGTPVIRCYGSHRVIRVAIRHPSDDHEPVSLLNGFVEWIFTSHPKFVFVVKWLFRCSPIAHSLRGEIKSLILNHSVDPKV